MANRVYDELYTEYGRMPTEEEVRPRLARRSYGIARPHRRTLGTVNLSKISVQGPAVRSPLRVPGVKPGA